jgi:hypothetical protein
MALNFAPGADVSWLAMDPDISDPELDQEPTFSVAMSSLLEQDSESDEDPDDDSDTSEVHPCLETTEDVCLNISDQDTLHAGGPDGVDLDNDTNAAYAEDLPDFVKRLQEQLLAGYTPPNHPSVDDPRGYTLTESEEHSLRHYIAWVDSCGTVKAYNLHAAVLQDAAKIEILTLYKVQKLAMKLLGLSSQMVDMCPKSCMAFTGSLKISSSASIFVISMMGLVVSHTLTKRVNQELKWSIPPLPLSFSHFIGIEKWQKLCNIDIRVYRML